MLGATGQNVGALTFEGDTSDLELTFWNADAQRLSCSAGNSDVANNAWFLGPDPLCSVEFGDT